MDGIFDRMMRAARLDAALYEEVEADERALPQATAVVLLSSAAAGIGAMGQAGIRGLFMATVLALVGWYIWAALTWFIGTRVLPEPQTRADLGQLLRTIGFASAPGVIRILGVISPLAPVVAVVAALWMIAAMVVAVRQALDYSSTGRAVGVCVLGFAVQLLLSALVFWPLKAF